MLFVVFFLLTRQCFRSVRQTGRLQLQSLEPISFIDFIILLLLFAFCPTMFSDRLASQAATICTEQWEFRPMGPLGDTSGCRSGSEAAPHGKSGC